ncbi:MAG: sugar ABC transporter ATP-binding protein, partial [bacterium]|nr:sugar ABC transporter ATP-binding protein [bacterium]
THHLQEIVTICDWITVIRDGKVSLSKSLHDVDLQKIIEAMIGRAIEQNEFGRFLERDRIDREHVLLEVKNLHVQHQLENISLKLHAGEILGIAGVLGSGRSELLKVLYGILPKDSGEISMYDKPVDIKHPADAREKGISLVPENRHKNGLIEGQSLRMNILLPVWKKLAKGFWIDDKKGKKQVSELIKKLKIKTTDSEQLIEHLSGGNQQKVVIAKSIVWEPNILLLDDPTVGVDVGAKQEILQSVNLLAHEKKGIILVSSEFEELANLCDRVLILRHGKIIQEFDREQGDTIAEGMLLESAQGEDSSASGRISS